MSLILEKVNIITINWPFTASIEIGHASKLYVINGETNHMA